MGKRIIQQRRGRGTSTYRVKRKSYSVKIAYPRKADGEGKIIKLINSGGHTSPLMIIEKDGKKYTLIAPSKVYEGKIIEFSGKEVSSGNVLKLKKIPVGTEIFNIEIRPGDGGKLIRAGGTCGRISKKERERITITLPSKKTKKFPINCRATIGRVAGGGRKEKPLLKAGKKWHLMKSKGKLYPRTSAVAMNVVDHPFGSGRGKNIGKTSIAPKNAPPGRKVGLLRPRRTGKRK